MSTKRKQKQFTKQFELDAEIIKLKRLAERKEVKARAHDKMFHMEDAIANDPSMEASKSRFHYEQASGWKKKADTLRQQINGIYERRIPRLAQAKAELATAPLAFMPKDCGVSV